MNRLAFLLDYYGKSQQEVADKVEAMRKERGYDDSYKCTQVLVSNLVNGRLDSLREEKLKPVLRCIADCFFCRQDKLLENITDREKFTRRIKRRDIFCRELRDRGINIRDRGGVAKVSSMLGFDFRDYAKLHQDLSDEVLDKIQEVFGIPREAFNVTLEDYQKSEAKETQPQEPNAEEETQPEPDKFAHIRDFLQYVDVTEQEWYKFCLLCEVADTDPNTALGWMVKNWVKDRYNKIIGKEG